MREPSNAHRAMHIPSTKGLLFATPHALQTSIFVHNSQVFFCMVEFCSSMRVCIETSFSYFTHTIHDIYYLYLLCLVVHLAKYLDAFFDFVREARGGGYTLVCVCVPSVP